MPNIWLIAAACEYGPRAAIAASQPQLLRAIVANRMGLVKPFTTHSAPAKVFVMERIQVEPEHYDWATYNTQARWTSYWHQIDEVLKASPQSCMEVGVGTGDVRRALEARGVAVTTIDIDDRLDVDRVGSVTALPCEDDEFDVVLCSQVLEHLPWAEVPAALAELSRVARTRVVVSVPQSGRTVRLRAEAPVIGSREFLARTPGKKRYRFDGQHYWQVGARGTRRGEFRRLLHQLFVIEDEYTVRENAYHRFYVLRPR